MDLGLNFLQMVLTPVLSGLAGQYGVLMQIISIMGVLRLVFKPLMTFLQAVVAATPTPADDTWLAAFMNSKAYNVVTFVIDWVASIKLPKP